MSRAYDAGFMTYAHAKAEQQNGEAVRAVETAEEALQVAESRWAILPLTHLLISFCDIIKFSSIKISAMALIQNRLQALLPA